MPWKEVSTMSLRLAVWFCAHRLGYLDLHRGIVQRHTPEEQLG